MLSRKPTIKHAELECAAISIQLAGYCSSQIQFLAVFVSNHHFLLYPDSIGLRLWNHVYMNIVPYNQYVFLGQTVEWKWEFPLDEEFGLLCGG